MQFCPWQSLDFLGIVFGNLLPKLIPEVARLGRSQGLAQAWVFEIYNGFLQFLKG